MLQHGRQYNESPARKLSQSFHLEMVGGKPITVKQTMLGAINTVISSHTPLKRSEDSHFKAFISMALKYECIHSEHNFDLSRNILDIIMIKKQELIHLKNQWKYPSLYLCLGSFLLTFAVMCNMLTLAFSLTLFAVKGNWLCGWSCSSGLRLLLTTTTKIGAMWPELV